MARTAGLWRRCDSELPRTVLSRPVSPTKRIWTAAAAIAVVLGVSQVIPASALAEPATEPLPPAPAQPPASEQPLAADGLQHNITYRARADGTSRGAVVAYKIDDTNVNSEQPTLLPARTFEVNTVLTDPAQAGMTVSIQWPYGSNLHCEILVDDQIVAQADQFIAPRFFRVKDDPLYGVLQCGAPLDAGVADVPATGVDPAAPPPAAPPVDAPAPPAA
jgi:hypothetical protein